MIFGDNTPLQVPPHVQSQLEERGIREEDIRQVLFFAEIGRQFHTHGATGHRLAYFTPSKVT